MKRQIKFRGKEIQTGEWLYGSHYNDGAEDYILENLPNSALDFDERQIDQNTIGQFTGLQDSNGNDIYEGDILKDKDWEVFEDKKSFVVSFDEISPRFLLGRTDGRSSNFQLDATFANRSVIIANIHDNFELLKGGEKCL